MHAPRLILVAVKLSRPMSLFLVAFGVWSWVIWPTFMTIISKDPRSFNDGPTPFFTVHLVLVIVSLVLGSVIGVLGVRGFLATRRR